MFEMSLVLRPQRTPWAIPLLLALAGFSVPALSAPLKGEKPREPGRWHEAPSEADPSTPSTDERQLIEQLEAIGYLTGSRDAAGEGVTASEPTRFFAGLNFFTSGHAPEAILMDMNGRVLHRWRKDFDDVWPGRPTSKRMNAEYWRRAHLYANGDVLAIFEGLGLLKLDRDSNLIWANDLQAHHDLQVAENGDIFVLERRAHIVPRISENEPILEDFLTILGPDGSRRRSVSLLEAFERSDFRSVLEARERPTGDIFHTNSVEILDGSVANQHPAFAAGNLLTAMNAMAVIAVVDLREEKVTWVRKLDHSGVHDPGILPNGNLLVFENRRDIEASRVAETSLKSTDAAWYYDGASANPFFSKTCGAAQRLGNGNTLITESDGGRALEIAPDGEVVWEFYNPHRAGGQGQFIATLLDLERLPADFPIDWLPNETARSPGSE
jgi:hypothetical protein